MDDAAKIAVDVRDTYKRYGDVTVLHQISLAIYDNEFFTLFGKIEIESLFIQTFKIFRSFSNFF